MLEDSRSLRLIELKREMALLEAEERNLMFLAARYRQQVRVQEDLLQVRQKLAKLARELGDVESEQ